MRKIEQQMLTAIHNKTEKWISDNTAVFYISANESGNPFGSRSEIYLHGNLIAEYWHDEKAPLAVNRNTLARWSTNTTKSRLRALGANVTTRKGVTYLNDSAI
jgi:hypothetical protein